MKKIFSLILALTMVCSLFTFTVEAGTNGSYKVTYEAVTQGADINDLEEGNIFLANFILTNAEGYFGSKIVVTWDSSVIVPCKTDGTLVTALSNDLQKWSQTTTNRVDGNKAYQQNDPDYYAIDEESGEETFGRDINAFGYQERVISDSGLTYATIPTTDYTGEKTPKDYLLSSDLNIISVRFKVVGTGDADISIDSNLTQETKADSDVRTATVNVPALTIGSSTPVTPPPAGDDTTEQKAKATATYKAGMTGIRFNVNNGDKTVGYAVKFAENTQLEAASKVSIGLTVTGIPSGKSVTITAENYYENAFGKLN